MVYIKLQILLILVNFDNTLIYVFHRNTNVNTNIQIKTSAVNAKLYSDKFRKGKFNVNLDL